MGRGMAAKTGKKKKTGINREVKQGRVYVNATFNNTLVTVTDEQGRTLAWGSAGRAGFRGTRKSTPYAATTAVDSVIKQAKDEFGLREVKVYIKGPGPGRDAALRAMRAAGLRMDLIADVTPVPYNGPRARKKRRA